MCVNNDKNLFVLTFVFIIGVHPVLFFFDSRVKSEKIHMAKTVHEADF